MTTAISFHPDGTAHCLWTEALPLREIGQLEVHRASTIEFNAESQAWAVRLASNPGVVAFSHSSRQTCLDWERNTINAQICGSGSSAQPEEHS